MTTAASQSGSRGIRLGRIHVTLSLAATLTLALFALCAPAGATTYEIGPGKALAAINDVPWESLGAGDTVLIYWREAPYKEKFAIGVSGTKESPITVKGVPGPNGELPVIDARDAVTRPGLSFARKEMSLLQFTVLDGRTEVPKNIIVENLELRSCRSPYTFTDSNGEKCKYKDDSGLIWFMQCDGVMLRNCTFRDGGMGVISCGYTKNITIEGCYFVDSGMEGPDNSYIHQCYMETIGMLYQYNHFSHLRKDCCGSNLKDRSIDNVIRYNWIEGGNKEIDLPDMYDTYRDQLDAAKRGDTSLVNEAIDLANMDRVTYIYGNVIIEPEGDGNSEMITYGGDMGEPRYYRKGMLHFYNNTVVSKRTDSTTIFKPKTNDESVDARNNIFYTTAPGSTLAILQCYGTAYLSHNWMKPGRVDSHEGKDYFGEVNDDGTTVTGDNPGFVDEANGDYHLAAGSPCIDAARNINVRALPANEVKGEYVKHQKGAARASDGKLDIGAYEFTGKK